MLLDGAHFRRAVVFDTDTAYAGSRNMYDSPAGGTNYYYRAISDETWVTNRAQGAENWYFNNSTGSIDAVLHENYRFTKSFRIDSISYQYGLDPSNPDLYLLPASSSVSWPREYKLTDGFIDPGLWLPTDFSEANPLGSQTWNASNGARYLVTDYSFAAVPVPAAVWLFGSGLGLLGWMRRKPS